MEGFVAAVTFLLIVASIWSVTTWRKLKDAEKLRDFVAWSVLESDDIRYNIPLWAHFKNAQNHTHIRDEYRVSGVEEWETVKGIIERYQKHLTKSYFNGLLWVPKSIYGLKSEEYFIYMLYVYLCEHEITGHNVVFHKMHYITYMYCKESMSLQKNVPAWNESVLKETLEDDLEKMKMTSHKIPVPSDPGIKVNYRGRP